MAKYDPEAIQAARENNRVVVAPKTDAQLWHARYFKDVPQEMREWAAGVKTSRNFHPTLFLQMIYDGKFDVNAESSGGQGEVGIIPFRPRSEQIRWYQKIIKHRYEALRNPQTAGRFSRLRVKSRRRGVTTGHSMFLCADATVNEGCNAGITAHSTDGLVNVSEIMRDALGRHDAKKERGVKGMATRRFETAAPSLIRLENSGPDAFRGWKVMHLLVTEADYIDAIDDMLRSSLPSVDKSPFASVVLESTMRSDAASGYKDFVERSMAGETAYKVEFEPWWTDETAIAIPSDDERDAILNRPSEYEAILRDKYHCTVEQIMWWRMRFREDARGVFNDMIEMYPSDLDECMKALQGVNFFNPDAVKFYKTVTCREPEKRYRTRYDEFAEIEDPHEWLAGPHCAMWQEPMAGREYIIGADGADAGIRKDTETGSESYAVILDKLTGEQVAEWHGHANAQDYGIALWRMARHYNMAWINPEKNACAATLDFLMKTLNYNRVCERETFGVVQEKLAGVHGFDTRSESRPVLVQRLQDNFNRRTLVIRSRYLLDQLVNFGKRKGAPNKAMARKGEQCDDGPIALALCMFGHNNATNGCWQPKDLLDYGSPKRQDITLTDRARRARGEIVIDDEADAFEDQMRLANAYMNRT